MLRVRTPARLTSAATVLALSTALVAGSAQAGPAEFSAKPERGAPGIGDRYFPRDGNGGIDVQHYDIHDRYAFGSGRLSGRTTLTLRTTEALSRFNLDFLLDVSSVRVDGRAATFDQVGDHELRITPAEPLAEGETVKVRVSYAGTPAEESSQGESNWLADAKEVVAMNEPHMATWWFPANDHPSDKATYDIAITAPRAAKVVANGDLVGRRAKGAQATTRWRASEPMASYLAFFAAGPFEVRTGSTAGHPWTVAVSKQLPPAQRKDGMELMLRSGDVTAWLETVLGTYPFSSTGGLMTSLDVGFALENQTRPTYPAVSSEAVSLIVHELAHQWFGDSVSVAKWRDIWLNEGFATYMEAYYAETHGGPTTDAWLRQKYADLLPSGGFWSVRVSDPGARKIFDGAVYDRGAMALAALRNRVGTAAFASILRGWAEQHRYGNATVDGFEAYAESVSGQDLDGFFAAWLDARTAPARTAENGLG